MKFTPLSIPDVTLIEPKVFRDDRGFFFESWRKEVFQQAGISVSIVILYCYIKHKERRIITLLLFIVLQFL